MDGSSDIVRVRELDCAIDGGAFERIDVLVGSCFTPNKELDDATLEMDDLKELGGGSK